ncbi:MAG: hypothetical protein UT16_C0002G0009 [Candidatus Azambacteria bacterium GW2011_GWA2_39_10]|uniref:Uncharacterized protein n=1 Tax=Candidatus Azambacteria bacterium GW2011_GWA2_39_10 TaxID=1618611 RepID=A0A0G0P460_9BACT|nr:MAG: hypothetical protein UT16_C0002G0009 [Candidatus Azambacteria bacterium GW2011_GWA2_39_10]
MSDALSDIARDERRNQLLNEYSVKARKFSAEPCKKNLDEAIAAARAVDGVIGGYWGGKTEIFCGIKKALNELKFKHGDQWEEFLGEISFIPIFRI